MDASNKRGEHAAFRERRAMRTRLQGATRLEPLGDCNEVQGADARPRRSASVAGLSATGHPAGRSGVPAGLISAGTDGTERNVVKWRNDGDRAGPTGALPSGAIPRDQGRRRWGFCLPDWSDVNRSAGRTADGVIRLSQSKAGATCAAWISDQQEALRPTHFGPRVLISANTPLRTR